MYQVIAWGSEPEPDSDDCWFVGKYEDIASAVEKLKGSADIEGALCLQFINEDNEAVEVEGYEISPDMFYHPVPK